MANRLRVTELDFDTIKSNLKTFLNQQTEFQDYDFEGAGLSVLLDILAYNTHYNAYYLNMVANESFLDTALLRDSAVSHAKTLGYIPYSSAAPVANINFNVDSGTTTPATLTIPSGFSFLSNQIDSKSYNFVVLEDTTVTKSNTTFHFDGLEIYEGQLVTYNFTYDSASNPKQVFILPDNNIDTDTIEVSVSPAVANTATSVYNKVTDILDITATSEAYFLEENRNGKYQIYFGNDIVGKSLPDGAIISVKYLITNGTAANKANNFIATATLTDSIGNSQTNFTVNPVSAASGGSTSESVDNIKFSARSQFSTQNRLVTIKDYESYILNNYPNIDSISVWGGEDNDPPVYGKVFASLKPRDNYYISEAEKQRIITEIINPKSIISVSAEIIDPTFLYFVIDVDARYDSKKTSKTPQTLKQDIKDAIIRYSDTYLNKFNARLVDSKLETAIDNVDLNAIIGNQLTIKVQKRFLPTLNRNSTYEVNFTVPLKRGTTTNRLSSTEFQVNDSSGVTRTVVIEEVPTSFTGISSILITNPGLNYLFPPTVTITGDGQGATAEAVIVNGTIKEIIITNRGIDYTRAIVTISGGGGIAATATAEIDSKIGTLRTIYYDATAQRQIVDSNVGEINYETGKVTLTDVNILSVLSTDGLMRITVESEKGIIDSVRNSILTIDENDPVSVVTTLTAVSN
jgi:hypothetical protein